MSERDTSPMLPEERDRHMVRRLARLEKNREDRKRGPWWARPSPIKLAAEECQTRHDLYLLSTRSAEFLGCNRLNFEAGGYRWVLPS